MNTCNLCGDYNHSVELHQDSETHTYNYFKYIESGFKDLKIRKDIERKESINVIETYHTIKDTMLTISNDRECGNSIDKDCEFTGTTEEVINHEIECMGFNRNVFNEEPKVSSNSITCDECGHEFKKSAKGMEPKYLLNKHLKTKRCNANIKTNILNQLKTQKYSNSQLNQLKELLNSFT
jgi:hypothetical protein